MIRKYTNPQVISIVGLILVLGLAWGFDACVNFLRDYNAKTFLIPFVIMWTYVLFNLLSAALFLLLFWFVLGKAPRKIWVSLPYLISGLLIALYPGLYFNPVLCCWMPYIKVLENAPYSYLYTAGGFIAITGLLALVLPVEKKAVVTGTE